MVALLLEVPRRVAGDCDGRVESTGSAFDEDRTGAPDQVDSDRIIEILVDLACVPAERSGVLESAIESRERPNPRAHIRLAQPIGCCSAQLSAFGDRVPYM